MEEVTAYLRVYAEPPDPRRRRRRVKSETPRGETRWWMNDQIRTLTIDTETRSLAQRLMFGSAVIARGETVLRTILFHDEHLGAEEQAIIDHYATANQLEVMTRSEFVDRVFFPEVYSRGTMCVGLNLPFDLSRLAIDWGAANGRFYGGFWLQLSQEKRWPRIRIRSLDSRRAFIEFSPTAGPDTRERGKGRTVALARGRFLDVRTLLFALTGDGHSLASAGRRYRTRHQKTEVEHEGIITDEYIAYNLNDLLATDEAALAALAEYRQHPIGLPPTRAYSSASLGKAYQHEMRITPLRKRQPDFPKPVQGGLMNAFYAGRAEVHVRKEVRRVIYCDFKSMYPTVNCLCNFWRFWTCERIEVDQDASEWVNSFLVTVQLDDLRNPKLWEELAAVVVLQPDGDVLPLRTHYGDSPALNIGLNYLTSDLELPYSLADPVAAKPLTGKPASIRRAVRFKPVGRQADLRGVKILGIAEVDPYRDDFFRKGAMERDRVKRDAELAELQGEKEVASFLDGAQRGLKNIQNATAYGINIETNVREQQATGTVHVFGVEEFDAEVKHPEDPGKFFNPVLGVLIPSAARLMLAIAETLATREGLTWTYCDTDSITFAQPEGMSEDEFLTRVQRIIEWFRPLNPYDGGRTSILEIERENYHPGTTELEPLYSVSISAKRNALFNLSREDGKTTVILRKVSEHGLGHLTDPYAKEEANQRHAALGQQVAYCAAPVWICEVWLSIINDLLAGGAGRVGTFPFSKKIAFSQRTVTTPRLLARFAGFNRGRPRQEQIRPWSFLNIYFARNPADHVLELYPSGLCRWRGTWELGGCPRPGEYCSYRARCPLTTPCIPIGPYAPEGLPTHDATKLNEALRWVVDQHGRSHRFGREEFATYGDLLREFAHHPESKFDGSIGELQRKHLLVTGRKFHGKETHNIEWQEAAGDVAPEDEVDLSLPSVTHYRNRKEEWHREWLPKLQAIATPTLVKATRLSERTIRYIKSGKYPRRKTMQRLMEITTRMMEG